MYQRYKAEPTSKHGLTQTLAELEEQEGNYYEAHLLYAKAARELRRTGDYDTREYLSLCDKSKECWHYSL